MEIKSEHRFEFWIVLFLNIFTWLLFIIYLFYASLMYEKLDFNNQGLWLAVILVIISVFIIKNFLYYDFKKIIVSEKGILVSYLIDNKTEFLEYKNILYFETNRESNLEFAGKNDGYQKLEIVLKGNEYITIGADEYRNYHELKKYIYSNFKKRTEK
ncbi:hypothetical protein [Tenacibaculum finnmarkense]|uniref:hypothetical protein n=1 Tax=Tenacibaculum finnmarkense TaxID=2781243 RepID=UPI0007392FC5|nr:hypothetical protein [Tenacibaculum finnmarkense]ALU74153.1 hypothetical protein AUW17_02180 [Tenacibaculum dicentrarchi]MBE7645917.1 hypothetical protein [Tenacibaculum finnmarkense genomovar ulcerans]MBE7688413.1 hypothetical protein [Tenacibaculum finnmarkense genomovar ulcerans]MCD8410354.1 hypothetical protein [Tenacibaculum finnmarkense genomovar ulcerans]MCD8422787.1 hypothetical protein [Tenacibaculum finnmarkense genomovar ulcerans]